MESRPNRIMTLQNIDMLDAAALRQWGMHFFGRIDLGFFDKTLTSLVFIAQWKSACLTASNFGQLSRMRSGDRNSLRISLFAPFYFGPLASWSHPFSFFASIQVRSVR